MLYHPDLRIAALLPPRCASHSIQALLEAHGFLRTETGGRHDVQLQSLDQWVAPFPDEWERVFCVVRNHWDTLVSWWGYHTVTESQRATWQGWDFGVWLDTFLEAPEVTGAPRAAPPRMWGTWLPHATHVVRFENLVPDLRRALPFNWQAEELPHIRDPWVKAGHYSKYYNEKTADLVRRAYSEEIAELGYECTFIHS